MKRSANSSELPVNKKRADTVPSSGSNFTFNSTPETKTADVVAVQLATPAEKVPGTVMTITTSANATLAPLRPTMVLVTTTLSLSLTPLIISSANVKIIVSPTQGPQGLLPITMPVTTKPAPQLLAKLIKLVAPPVNETVLPGVNAQPNAHLPVVPVQQAFSVPPVNMLPPASKQHATI